CPVVNSVQHDTGNTYIVNWMIDAIAQYWVSASGTDGEWGLYLITNYQYSGHYINGGNWKPIKTINRSAPLPGGGGDNCTVSASHCNHSVYGPRFMNKFNYAGSEKVDIPTSATNSCIVFGMPVPVLGVFAPVFPGTVSYPVCGAGGISVPEPPPDPDWCGMSTASLDYNFGTMAPEDVDGQSITKPAVMTCNKAGVSYNLYLQNVSSAGRDTIDLGLGVSATVTVLINGVEQSLQSNRVSTSDINPMDVKVTLNGTPGVTGTLGGQNVGILAVNYY
ncbi:hypothetical protein, partial [Entomohabitans teleogrylli]|uniref:hypothetical protein n=1 Tax=Entomohabitans teleogrylli TaxID=1384589 RepID=UPI000A9565C8